jgi:hypothetical protein
MQNPACGLGWEGARFEGNVAHSEGGAVAIKDFTARSLNFTGCTFIANKVRQWGKSGSDLRGSCVGVCGRGCCTNTKIDGCGFCLRKLQLFVTSIGGVVLLSGLHAHSGFW